MLKLCRKNITKKSTKKFKYILSHNLKVIKKLQRFTNMLRNSVEATAIFNFHPTIINMHIFLEKKSFFFKNSCFGII
jgi:two-component SAPR family response regulator